MRPACLVIVAAVFVGASPVHAFAATASVAGPMLVYEAAGGETNQVTIVRSPDVFRIVDPGATITPGRGCTPVAANAVSCSAASVFRISVALGDANDFVSIGSLTRALLDGGPGDDTLEGGEGADALLGRDGNDVLKGGVGEDELTPGKGADTVSGGAGTVLDLESETLPEEISAGFFVGQCQVVVQGVAGFDTVDYAARTRPLALTLDGVANDGEAGEGDNILPDVEFVKAGSGDDLLVGNDGFNALRAAGGDDVIRGGGFPDLLLAGPGNDRIDGGARGDLVHGAGGNDVVLGSSGRDCLMGADGDDRIVGGDGPDGIIGGRGRDRMLGGAANDVLIACDRTPDVIDGGGGRDRASADRRRDALLRIELMLPCERPPDQAERLTGANRARKH